MSTEVQEHGAEQGEDDREPVTGEPASSLLGRISKRREERSENEELTLGIPTWGGDLMGRYRVLDPKTLEKITERIKGSRPDPGADRDFLARACSGIFIRDPETYEVKELVDESGESIGFDTRLTRALGLDEQEYDSARKLLTHLFKYNDLAVSGHCVKIINWMQDTSSEVDGAVLGESVGQVRLS